MNEDLLEARGPEPLLHVVQKVRDLYNGKTTVVDGGVEAEGWRIPLHHHEDKEKERNGLTAAIAYLHTKG